MQGMPVLFGIQEVCLLRCASFLSFTLCSVLMIAGQ